MSKTKRNVFAALLLSWASLNPAFAQDPASNPGTATLDGGSSAYSTQGGGYSSPTPMGNGYYGQTFEPSAQYAQQPPPYNPYYSGMVPNYADDPAYTGYVPYDSFSSRLMTRSDIGTGLGYQNGYQTFAGMLPVMLNPDYSLLFASIRGVVGYDDSYGFSTGGGARWYVPEIDRVFGGSFWFDDDKRNPNRYQQFGVSVESLGTYLDFRINAYMPRNQDQRQVSKSYTGEVFFINHNLGLGQRTVLQSPMRGGDFEVGGAVPLLGDFGMRGYLGSYYFDGDGVGSGSMVGFKSRLEAMVTEDLWVQLGVTDDRFFGTNTTMAVTLFLPDGSPDRVMSRQPTQERLYMPVERNYRVTVHEHLLTDPELAINPRTGLPYYIDHVDNTNAASGDGTVENPFDSLPSSRPGTTDIIYVHTGDGTTTNMSGGITLADYQALWGDGVLHTIHAVQGDFDFLTGTPGELPHITNVFGNAVTLANFNEVSGFRIDAPLASGIYGSGITDFNINNVHVTDAGNHGIELINATNSPGTPGIIALSSVLDSTNNGIHIENTDGSSLEVNVSESTINRNIVGIEASAQGGSSIDIGVGLSNLNANSIGFEAASTTGSAVNAIVTDSTATNNSAGGIEAHTNGGVIDLTVSGIEAALNGTSGIVLEALNAGNINATILDSILVGNHNHGLLAESDSSLLQIVATGNQFDSNYQNGMRVIASNNSLFNALLTSNTFDSNEFLTDAISANGLSVTLNSLSIGNLIAQTNSFSNNEGTGATFGINGGSTLTTVFTQNTFDGNGSFGFQLTSTDSTHVTTIGGPSATNDGNIFTDNIGAAIAINQVNTGTGSLIIQSNTFTGTQDDANNLNDFWGDAINVRLNGTNATNSLTSALVDGNIIGSLTDASLGNAGRGVYFYAEDFTTLANVTVSSNIIASNGDNGIEFTRRNNATVDNIVIADNNIQLNQINAPRITQIGNSLNDPWVPQFSGNGIFITASGSNVDASMTPLLDDYLITGNIVDKNEMNGLHLRVESDASIEADVSNNTFNSNASNGILASERLNDTTDLRSISGNWTGNTISDNAGIATQASGIFVGLTDTGNGIRLAAQTSGLNIGLDGAGLGNTITNNGVNIDRTIDLISRIDSGNGIDISSAGTVSIANNLISGNFKGIRYSPTFVSQTLIFDTDRVIELTKNEIIDNRDDGLEITQGHSIYDDFLSVVATENIIANNGGRGVDVFNTVNGDTELQFGDGTNTGGNVIEGNAFEGFFVVNTSSATTITGGQFTGDIVLQDTNDALGILQATGGTGQDPNIVMDLQYNRIQGNGALSDHPGTGVVLYVGTAFGTASPFSPGDFGTNSATDLANGRVNARIVNNEFGGNAGNDFYVQSFTSTIDPPSTQGTWNLGDANPVISDYFPDPLARLNLVFRGNTGDGIRATSVQPLIGVGNEAAYYDNDEANFKSRTSTSTPAGPFNSGTRQRNAQRRGADLDIPVVATSFYYPGMGESTFRVESDVDISGFTGGLGFLIDGAPIPFNYSGLFLPGPGLIDQTPYGWGEVPVGTFQFLIP